MKKVIVQLVVFAILFRPEVTSIPQYIIMAKLQVIDTYWALILPAMGTSFGVFLLMQFMEAIPNEIIESCRIDGAKEDHPVFPPDSAHGQARLADGGDFHLYQRVEHQRGAIYLQREPEDAAGHALPAQRCGRRAGGGGIGGGGAAVDSAGGDFPVQPKIGGGNHGAFRT